MTAQRPSTAQARTEIAARKKAQEAKGYVDNASLYAGSPMYFYCRLCTTHIATLNEDYTHGPPAHCTECAKLIAQGWSVRTNRFAEYEDVQCTVCRGHGNHGVDYYTQRLRTCSTCGGNRTVRQEIPASPEPPEIDLDVVAC